MEFEDKFIRFDWAVKRMLRDKANFAVLEGLITVLLEEKVTITEILESEANQDTASDKFNRVDIKALNSKGEIIIVEVQLTRQLYYLQRMLYGVSKAITEHIHIGELYSHVKKVYSINILYFDLGRGSDYLYHGTTSFIGVHSHDRLEVNTKEENEIRLCWPEKIFPEYYIIRVNEFNQVATTPLEEWLDYLKNNRIKECTQTPGLREARERLLCMTMNERDRAAYHAHLDNLRVQNDVLDTAKMEGREEGRAEGRAEGLEEGRAEGLEEGRAEGRAEGLEEGRASAMASMVRNMRAAHLTDDEICRLSGISPEMLNSLEL